MIVNLIKENFVCNIERASLLMECKNNVLWLWRGVKTTLINLTCCKIWKTTHFTDIFLVLIWFRQFSFTFLAVTVCVLVLLCAVSILWYDMTGVRAKISNIFVIFITFKNNCQICQFSQIASTCFWLLRCPCNCIF